MSELPVGWAQAALGELVDVIRGVTFPASSKVHEASKDVVACLRTSHIQEKLLWDNIYYIPKQYVRREQQLTRRNDILMSMANSANLVGKVCINESDQAACFGAFLAAIRCREVDHKYIYYFLRSSGAQSKLRATASQTVNIANISVAELSKLKTPLPPLAEQKRIAQKLDALLAQVDALKTRIDAIPTLIGKFRQSVLHSATSGQLTADWRVHHPHPAANRSLDIAGIHASWNWSNTPESWDVDSYQNVVNSKLGKMLDKAKNNGIPTPYLGNINVRWGHFNLENLQEILASEDEIEEMELRKGDVLICEGGEPGRCAVWNSDKPGIIYQKALHRARASHRLLPDLLVFNLKNDADNTSLSQLFTGTTIKHLTASALKRYPLRIPPLEEQAEIIRRVQQLFAYADQLETKVSAAQQRIDTLTQSLLTKAFRGELAPQDPNDEPASVLLERLTNDQATTGPRLLSVLLSPKSLAID